MGLWLSRSAYGSWAADRLGANTHGREEVMPGKGALTGTAFVLLLPGAAAERPAGSAFTYQGRLTDAGLPANGSYDLQFTLYNAPTVGGVVAGPIVTNDVP
jgi:hypothetical protein